MSAAIREVNMKVISKLFTVLALSAVLGASFVCLFAFPYAFAAETQWARITENNVSLYAAESSSKVICFLEKSYYVKILEETDNMLLVSVMGWTEGFPEICGYVYKEDTEICGEPKTPYYPAETVTVCGDSAALKLSPTPNAETIVVATNTQQLRYYGKIVSYSKTWYYVYYAGKFGYVETDNVTEVKVALHPTPLPSDVPVVVPPTDPEKPNEPETPQTSLPASEILLIVFVVLLAVGLTLALFAPGNKRAKNADVFDKEI